MVTQHGSTTLTIPSHDDDLATSGTHTVTMVSADGTQTQPVWPGGLLGVSCSLVLPFCGMSPKVQA